MTRKTCVCGRIALPGSTRCALHQPDERARTARQPYRREYGSAELARNRKLAYERVGGRCEHCGRTVGRGEWECDHVIPVRVWLERRLPGSPHQLGNLAVLCIVRTPDARHGCHGIKTVADRQAYPPAVR